MRYLLLCLAFMVVVKSALSEVVLPIFMVRSSHLTCQSNRLGERFVLIYWRWN